jgi:ribulose-5-phosphate 4-epimerase/fuculose-1-phosphate aldolase
MVSSSGGNVSVRDGDCVFVTPSGKSLGRLTPEIIVRTDRSGEATGRGRPSKEIFLHCAVYHAKPDVTAVVHVHSPFAIAVSCLAPPGGDSVLPPMTPGYVIRVGNLPMVEYLRPGSPALAESAARLATRNKAILLQNHGLITSGKDLEEAINLAEEVEENAKIFILTGGKGRSLNQREVAEILDTFGRK